MLTQNLNQIYLKSILILYFLLTSTSLLLSNDLRKIDSLKSELELTKSDTSKINILFEIGRSYEQISLDTSTNYFFMVVDQIKSLQNEGETNFTAYLKRTKGAVFRYIGVNYWRKGDYDVALEYYMKSLKINEELFDTIGMAKCYNNIGVIHNAINNFEKARENQLIALELKKAIGNKRSISSSHNNLGVNYWKQAQSIKDSIKRIELFNKALDSYQKSFELAKEIDSERMIAFGYLNIGIVQIDLGKYEEAIDNCRKSLEIRNGIGDKYTIIEAHKFFSKAFLKASLYYRKTNKSNWLNYLDSALYYANIAYKDAHAINALHLQIDIVSILQESYSVKGKYKEAIKYAEIFISLRDSMFKEEKTKAIQEVQVKYEIEKKEQELLAKDAIIKHQNTIKNALLGGLVVILAFIFFIVFAYTQKRKANLKITQQNKRLVLLNEEVNSQKKEIESQRDQVIKQKKQLTDSIEYAGLIQQALLPSNEILKNTFPEHFIFFQPRDEIGGDFYWIKNINQFTIIAAADSTGHGVPGAMLSILGIAILNELVRRKEIQTAAELLEKLRNEIKSSLQQDMNSRGIKDGMDIAVCVIDNNTLEMQYSGANSPIYIVKNLEIEQIKPTENPIGVYFAEEAFRNENIQLAKGNIVYMFTDGFMDQFGGDNGRKFYSKNFKSLLQKYSDKPMSEQQKFLGMTFNEWKRKHEQNDDVLVMGIKI